MVVNQTWLDQVREEPIDPAYPVIDPHHHIWPTNPRRGYIYLIDDLVRDLTAGHNVRASVFIQCSTMYRQSGSEHLKPIGETEWVNGIAEQYAKANPSGPAIMAGIVGHCNLAGDRVDEVLETHMAAAPKRFRGIRHVCTWTDDVEVLKTTVAYQKDLLIDPAFRRGFARLQKYGLSFDSWIFHPQLPHLADLARAHPGIPIVINHLGAPLGQGTFAARKDEVFAEWRQSIDALAACPNVHMKLGGSAMPLFGFAWDSHPKPPSSDELIRAARHFYDYAIEKFSPSRCMFESNFPVDKEQCAYIPLWNSFKKMTANFSKAEKADMLYNTARRFYRLEAVTSPSK
ncbi:MAG: amidohydrolase [Betaproteobacteria bacterium]|nr:amidohydrolase [Betaproteobacteria bacterium]